LVKDLALPSATAGLFLYVLKNPDRLSGALPKFIAEWHEQWARVTRAKTDRLRAKKEAYEFEVDAQADLEGMTVLPSATEFASHDSRPLELPSQEDERPRRMFLTSEGPDTSADASGRPALESPRQQGRADDE
jgi:hypothetical protein